MRSSIFIAALFTFSLVACSKDPDTFKSTPTPVSTQNSNFHSYGVGNSRSRYAGSDYSQSIPISAANSMIQSYLESVSYPSTDTALRSLTFDADTLRAYLQNPNIVTLKFVLAHDPSYMTAHAGEYSGMNPNAVTMIVVGLNDSDQYVLNNRNEVYEHFKPCPNYCTSNSSPFIF